ncbi:uncharacterized protein BP01DRAFT_385950 [Aspergillus saccharolyticus JOP 1030-1]|uniref:Uncharacterized protein n=1 Tax=Aspergillus saccharolyticus JOP 1030-1 TaxID=1450539 RepID=A0A318Z4B4_9EURO|nr:hypothetical protein BP01DRAFT_385950 [Aspergillus saccharolyticus JOP 1030-1]PYH41926.1 hypothetical protein BP01DRAFT_385950 [Aspergillus saccharolyticus JOP 1030-1]
MSNYAQNAAQPRTRAHRGPQRNRAMNHNSVDGSGSSSTPTSTIATTATTVRQQQDSHISTNLCRLEVELNTLYQQTSDCITTLNQENAILSQQVKNLIQASESQRNELAVLRHETQRLALQAEDVNSIVQELAHLPTAVGHQLEYIHQELKSLREWVEEIDRRPNDHLFEFLRGMDPDSSPTTNGFSAESGSGYLPM